MKMFCSIVVDFLMDGCLPTADPFDCFICMSDSNTTGGYHSNEEWSPRQRELDDDNRCPDSPILQKWKKRFKHETQIGN